MTGELRAIWSWRIFCPRGWASVPPKADNSEWPEAVAEKLCDRKRVRVALARRLRAVHPALVDLEALMVGVWVPDRSVADIAGLVTLEGIVPDPGRPLTRAYYRGLIEPDRRSDVTVYRRIVEETDVPSGPALCTHEIIARSDTPGGRETIRENLIYTVFPPGSADALRVSFVAYGVDASEVLAEHAANSMDTLTVELGEVVS